MAFKRHVVETQRSHVAIGSAGLAGRLNAEFNAQCVCGGGAVLRVSTDAARCADAGRPFAVLQRVRCEPPVEDGVRARPLRGITFPIPGKRIRVGTCYGVAQTRRVSRERCVFRP